MPMVSTKQYAEQLLTKILTNTGTITRQDIDDVADESAMNLKEVSEIAARLRQAPAALLAKQESAARHPSSKPLTVVKEERVVVPRDDITVQAAILAGTSKPIAKALAKYNEAFDALRAVLDAESAAAELRKKEAALIKQLATVKEHLRSTSPSLRKTPKYADYPQLCSDCGRSIPNPQGMSLHRKSHNKPVSA